MKKNVMMRVASAMLVLTLLTTCIISGTFAKYTTKGEFSDSARVAKWGVEIGIDGQDMFKKTYAKDGTTTDTTIVNTVIATEAVVAPGTKNEDGVTITVTGKPEVAFKLTFAMEGATAGSALQDVFLPAGTGYTDYTELKKTTSSDGDGGTTTSYGYTGKFDVADPGYYPVKYTLTKNDAKVAEGNLAAIETYLEGNSATTEYAANQATAINDTYVLTWAWAIDGNDKADTLLGNIAAGKATVTGASTSIAYKLTVTATQID